MTFSIPDDRIYSQSHEWALVDSNTAIVGITDFAQDELGDIVFVESPEEGKEYSQADECAVIESVKSTSDIYCPLSGVVTQINIELEDNPDLINSEPYSGGWIFSLKASDDSELDELIDANSYHELISED